MNKQINELTLQKITNNVSVLQNKVLVESIQEYKNPYNEAINIDYRFPLPSQAAVYSFEVIMKNQTYIAKIKETKEAEKIYKEQTSLGNTASLLSKYDNGFNFMISNIEATAEFKIVIKYIYMIEAKRNTYFLNIPTVLAPKYKSSRFISYNEPFQEEPDKKEIATHSVNTTIKIYNAKETKIVSDHDGKIITEKYNTIIKFENIIPNRDIVIEYKIENNNEIISASKNDETYSLINYMEEESENEEITKISRKYLFMMDASGSMSGIKFERAKNSLKLCLRNLDEEDNFNILFFHSYYVTFSDNFLEANDKNIEKADKYIDSIMATGGTEILKPLSAYIFEDNLTIMLFTDGQVWDSEKIYSIIKQKGNGTRLFCTGIDDSIDEGFINQMAKFGEGRSEFLNSSEDIYEKIIHQMFCTFSNSKKIVVKTSNEERIRNLYEGDSFVMLFNEKIKEVAYSADDVSIDIEQKNNDSLFEELKMSYYYSMIQDKELPKERIIKYSIEGNILSNYTSFILIKENEEKINAKTNISIVGMPPSSWEDSFRTSDLEDSNRFFRGVDINACFCNSIINTNTIDSFDDIDDNVSYEKEETFSSTYRAFPKSTSMAKKKAFISSKETNNNLNIETMDELMKLFILQKRDGSIDGKVELTKKAIELFKKYGEPKIYKKQYKKALAYLKKQEIKI